MEESLPKCFFIEVTLHITNKLKQTASQHVLVYLDANEDMTQFKKLKR